MGNLDFGCVVSPPDTTYITPFPLILAPFISFPIGVPCVHWVHIGLASPSLCPHFGSGLEWCPGGWCNEKEKKKHNLATLNRKCTTKCKRWPRHTNLARGQKPNISSTPYPWPSPWFLWALDEPAPSLRNPWLSQPWWAINCPTSKAYPLLHITHHALHPLEFWVVSNKNQSKEKGIWRRVEKQSPT